MDYHPFVSIVIPTKNESEDISITLEACLSLEYEPKEVIVVDDSKDDTPHIVEKYISRGVRLFHRDKNRNGCCGARNLGMQQAKGEIAVLLNADATPQPNFLDLLIPHYQNGADFVVVRSIVKNPGNIWAFPLYARTLAYPNPDPNWTEGFSCRVSAAKAVGYIPGDFPVTFCRDYMFGARLKNAGFVKHIDMSIEMEHVWPDRFRTFWANQVHRGAHAAPTYYYFRRRSIVLMILREFLKLLRTLGLYLLIFPKIVEAIRLSKVLKNRWRSAIVLWFVGFIDDIATVVGNFKGVSRVLRAELLS